MIKLSDNIELILECSKIKKNKSLIKEKLIVQKDWFFFLNLCHAHGVYPVIHDTLKDFENIIPVDVFMKSKSINLEIIKKNMLMTFELIRLMQLYEKSNIDVLSFKGPSLSKLAYGDILLRQYVDLDILVNKIDFDKIVDINYKNGYIMSDESFLKNKKKLNYLKDISFFNSNTGVSIELHFKVFNLPLLNKFNIFKSSYKMSINNYDLNIFDLNYLLVYLSIHGSRHIWERIEWITDIDRLIVNQQENIDFNSIYIIAKKLDSENSVNLAFYLCINLLDNKILLENIDEINFDKNIRILAEKVIKNYDINLDMSNYEIFNFHNKLFKKKSSKLLHLLSVFKINDRDLEFIKVNKKFYFLYYLIKPFRIIKKNIK